MKQAVKTGQASQGLGNFYGQQYETLTLDTRGCDIGEVYIEPGVTGEGPINPIGGEATGGGSVMVSEGVSGISFF